MRTTSVYLLALLAAVQGLATCLIDSGRAHATNREWPAHARFHAVWQFSTTLLLAGTAEYVLFGSLALSGRSFRVAALLTSLPMFSFLMALGGRRLYGGSVDDGSRWSWVKLCFYGRIWRLDLNLAAVLIGLAVLIALCWMHHFGRL